EHAGNPVDWYPWGEEAFAKAKREDKPVFVSIGYSACHWCHVMARESFEDPEIAAMLNRDFVSIKVDREERPDVDEAYMSYVTASAGRGGWPMSVFLTPEGNPFFGGTYFPAEARGNLPAFRTVLGEIAQAWKERRDEVESTGRNFRAYLSTRFDNPSQQMPTEGIMAHAYRDYSSAFDRKNGGIGRAPKFPSADWIRFLFRYAARYQEPDALAMAELTLRRMAAGGIFDQVGGGFHRYSVDAEWFVPHFEKMLYDQALLLGAYTDAYLITRDPFYARIATQTADFALREMRTVEGAFVSALDADSVPAGGSAKKEGAYYLWTWDELAAVLPEEDLGIFATTYGMKEGGNVDDDPSGEFEGLNLPVVRMEAEAVASALETNVPAVRQSLLSSRLKLYAARSRRIPPHRDDKILADWNSLLITELARASRVFGQEEYGKAAREAMRFVLTSMRSPGGKLHHSWREKKPGAAGQLLDYAAVIRALTTLYQTDFNTEWLTAAADLANVMIRDFWDDRFGAFFMTASGSETLLPARVKEFADGAVPSGNSVAVQDLLILERMTQSRVYAKFAMEALKTVHSYMAMSPTSFAQGLAALDFFLTPGPEIVVAARNADPAARELVQAVWNAYLPNRILLFHPEGPGGEAIRQFAPFIAGQTPVDGRAAAYVCRNYICERPVTDPGELQKALKNPLFDEFQRVN
ncbi:MAG: thioredoxin domain-containing protein, partial [Candidatus Omnitrophica bacterium]|nr:thioredoxin domain-containing protein [Candidatus Omnitrophota bacterium]